ncbi:MAG TPA: hypothetical protein VJC21_06120 [Candidatus Nanoarchaeia archaeon]|nr:hypothetical protein [Candidatus Nanoarchaeia archaeon]
MEKTSKRQAGDKSVPLERRVVFSHCPTTALDDWKIYVFVDLLHAPEELHAELLAELHPLGGTYEEVARTIPQHLRHCPRCLRVYQDAYAVKVEMGEIIKDTEEGYQVAAPELRERVLEVAEAYAKKYTRQRRVAEAFAKRKLYH